MDKLKKLYVKYESVILYVIFGGFTTLVSFGTHFGSRMIGSDFSYLEGGFSISALNDVMASSAVSAEAATVISWICAVTFAFFTNKAYVFKSRTHTAGAFIKQFLAFYGARLVSLALEAGIILVFVTLLGCNELFTKLIAQIVILVSNYLFSKLVIFGKGKDVAADDTENKEAP